MKAGRIRVLILAGVDVICIYACWALSLWGYRAIGLGHYRFGFEFYLKLWPVGVAFVILNMLFRLYHGNPFYPASPVTPQEELRRLVGSSLFTHLGLIAFLAFARQTTVDYSRVAMAGAGLLTALFCQPMRDLARHWMHRLGVGQIPVCVVGSPTRRREVARDLADDAYAGLRPVPDGAERTEVLVVATESGSLARDFTELFDRHTFVEQMPDGGMPSYEFVNQRRMSALRVEKRILDTCLSVVAFLVFLPFFILIPLGIWLTDKGPVFYRQARLGKQGRPIRVWKFRSMYVDADARLEGILAADPIAREEWSRNFKLANDPRVTPFGHFLRKTSLDELPQLFNVFAGEMALVGPRPIVAAEVPHYGDAYPVFASVRPGVTGLWQVSGRSGTEYGRRVALDSYYVLNWSPWLDIWILRRTLGAVLGMRGAC